jgi:hypothetical protein
MASIIEPDFSHIADMIWRDFREVFQAWKLCEGTPSRSRI